MKIYVVSLNKINIFLLSVETKPWESSGGGKHNGTKNLNRHTTARSINMATLP